MRRYETIFIVNPEFDVEERSRLFIRVKALIKDQGGFLILFDEWGERKLAYEVKKMNRGFYVRIDYCGDGALVSELERTFRIDDRILKYLTVLLDNQPDLEAIKEEVARVKAEEKEATAAKEKEAALAPEDEEIAPAIENDEKAPAPEVHKADPAPEVHKAEPAPEVHKAEPAPEEKEISSDDSSSDIDKPVESIDEMAETEKTDEEG